MFRAGWLVRDCKDCGGCATGRKLYERLSSLSPPGERPFRSFSSLLARISATAVSKLFLCFAVKGLPVARCVYIRACSENRRCRAKAHPPSSLELCNLANLVDCGRSSRGSLLIETLLVRLCDAVWFLFSVSRTAIRVRITYIRSKATECTQVERKVMTSSWSHVEITLKWLLIIILTSWYLSKNSIRTLLIVS